jgi:hypothetical protein
MQAIFGIALIAFFSFQGLQLIWNPERSLVKLGRPTTAKHIRATRLIGAMFLLFDLMVIVQWLRY